MGDKSGSGKLVLQHTTSTLAHLEKVLPKFQSKTVVDLPIDFRDKTSDIYNMGDTSARYLFWNNQRLSVYYNGGLGREQDDELCLHYTNKALSLLPPLRMNDIPHYDELFARNMRALATALMGDYESALVEYRVCLASVRLLHHAGRLDMSNPKDMIMKNVNIWPHMMIRMMIKVKIQNGISRPYFTKDESLDVMKEFAYGIYSPKAQQCTNCGKTEKLSLCAGCKGAWFCGKSCAKDAWKAGHKQRCGLKKYYGDILGEEKEEVVPFMMPSFALQKVLDEIEGKDVDELTGEDALGISMLNLGDRNFLVLCKDPNSGETFDALTDETFDLQVGTTITRGSKWGGTIHFHCMPEKPPKSEE